MRRELTKGDTLSPPLFKMFINDLPHELRQVLKNRFPNSAPHKPALLFADYFIDLTATHEEMQAITDTCCAWARKNNLRLNPKKSQLLRMIMAIRAEQQRTVTAGKTETGEQQIKLDGTRVQGSDEADYLGMKISTKRGVVCEDGTELITKGKAWIAMISSEKWFYLSLQPNFLAKIYETQFRVHCCTVVNF